MILFINNLRISQLNVGLFEKGNFYWLKKSISQKKNEKILLTINKILDKNNKTIKDLKGILVVNGPGSFSGIRVALSVANTLAWALNIPAIGIPLEKKGDQELFEKGLKKLKKEDNQKSFGIVKPFYGKKPNITKPKNNL